MRRAFERIGQSKVLLALVVIAAWVVILSVILWGAGTASGVSFSK